MSIQPRSFRFAVTVTEDEISVSVCDGHDMRWCAIKPVELPMIHALLRIERLIHALPATQKPTDAWREERDAELARVLEGMTARSADG